MERKVWLLKERKGKNLFLDKIYHGELNDKIDQILHIPKNDHFYSYFLYYDDQTLSLRIPGMTIGHISIEDNIITGIVIYDRSFTKNKTFPELKEFINDSIILE